MSKRINAADLPELENKMVVLNRVSKTVKGGRIARFAAIMAVGDGKGHIDPKGLTTRSQMAALIERFCEKVAN